PIWIQLLPGMRGQAQGDAATCRHRVDVASLDKGDRVCADIGETQQARIARRQRMDKRGRTEKKYGGDNRWTHHKPQDNTESLILASRRVQPKGRKARFAQECRPQPPAIACFIAAITPA